MALASKVALIVAVALTLATGLRADGIYNPAVNGKSGAVGFIEGVNNLGVGGNSGPASTGKILLVDGSSFLLQTDAASKICIAGGC